MLITQEAWSGLRHTCGKRVYKYVMRNNAQQGRTGSTQIIIIFVNVIRPTPAWRSHWPWLCAFRYFNTLGVYLLPLESVGRKPLSFVLISYVLNANYE